MTSNDIMSKHNDSSSSEDEIIIRGKPKNIVDIQSSISAEHDEMGEEDLEYVNPLFQEIFGDGNEYDYVYSQAEKDEKDENNDLSEKETDDFFTPNEIDCCKYVNRFVYNYDNEEIIKRLFNGECVEYIVFQIGLGTIKDVYFLKCYYEEYFEFIKLKNLNHKRSLYLKKEGSQNNGNINQKKEEENDTEENDTEEVDNVTLRSLEMKKRENMNDLKIPGILDISKYIKNLNLGEKVYESIGDLSPDFENSPDFKKVVKQLSFNPTFIDNIYMNYEKRIIENPIENRKNKIFESVMNSNEILNLIRFFCDTRKSTSENEIRKNIIFQSIENVSSNITQNFFNSLKENLIKKGIIPSTVVPNIKQQSLSNSNLSNLKLSNPQLSNFIIVGLQELTNLLVSLKGRPNEKYVGIYLKEKFVRATKIDEFGNIILSRTFFSHEIKNIEIFIEEIKNVVISSSSSLRFKSFIQNIQNNVFYLPKYFSIFDNLGEYSTSYNIAACVQNPGVYFSRAIYERKNFKLKNSFFNNSDFNFALSSINSLNNSSESSFSTLGSSNKYIDYECLKKAICILSGSDKLDWLNTLKHKYGFTFFKLIGIKLSDRQCDLESPKNLKSLEYVFDEKEKNIIYTYFKFIDSTNLLDTTNLHLDNYEAFKVISEVVTGSSSVGSDSVVKVLNNLNLLKNLNVEEISVEGYSNLEGIKGIVTSKNLYFQGACDKMIFEDILPNLFLKNDEKIVEKTGVVTKAGADYYIVDADVNNDSSDDNNNRKTTVSVYIKKSLEAEVNQIVNVRILYPDYSKLCFNGIIISCDSHLKGFTSHRLYSTLPDKQIKIKKLPIVIKSANSIRGSYCQISCLVYSNIYFSFKLLERSENGANIYELLKGDRLIGKFKSIDNFIESYLHGVKNLVKNVINFKYFKSSKEEAISYMLEEDNESKYMRYCIFISDNKNCVLEILMGNKHFISIFEGGWFIFNNLTFNILEKLIGHLKNEYTIQQ